MPKLTLTVEYDDGTTKEQSADLDAMPNADLDKLLDDAALQAGYLSTVEGKRNPQSHFEHLSEYLFNVLIKMTQSYRINRDVEVARKAASDGVSKVRPM